MSRIAMSLKFQSLILFSILLYGTSAMAQEPLFEYVGPPDSVNLPEHAVAGQNVRVNRRALQSPRMSIELFGETFIAQRQHVDRQKAGQLVWTGFLDGNPGNTVILTIKGSAISGMIQNGAEMYRIGSSSAAGNRLYYLDLELLPPEDAGGVPQGDGDAGASLDSEALAENTVQDLLVVYVQQACDAADSANPGNDCSQLEADIVTAVADINATYAASGINITMNLAGTHKTVYPSTDSSTTLSALTSTTDGNMDEVHGVRDSLGADLVAMVFAGSGCGVAYLGSSASSAFSVTHESCLVGNRTLNHELGHNQGAHHDRVTVGNPPSGDYKYGYRRCNDGSVDDFGSPYFRTVMSYGCTSAGRVGRMSNPNINYSGVPQGVDPDINPDRAAFNARTLNESASYVAGFRTAPSTTPPDAPSGLLATATGPDAIDLQWSDNSSDETSFEVRRSLDNSSWTIIATLAANATSFSDSGLNADTLYYYGVRAGNSAGWSAWTASASDSTDPLPSSIDDVATGDLLIKGDVSGSYTATHNGGGSVQTISETHSGGPKHSRKQAYEHGWTFDVFGGAGGVVVFVDAWVSGSEGANFFYSTDGGATRNLMFTVDNNASNGGQTFALPGGTSGAVRIYVEDATQTNGEAVDSVSVDHIVITSWTDAGDPPAAPSAMSVTGTTSSSVSVQFNDNSEDEFGFELWRATSDPAGNCSAGSIVDSLPSSAGTGLVFATDNTAAPSTTYWFWAVSFNGAGDNGSCSNAAFVTTLAGSDIPLAVSGYKAKGEKIVDLAWSGALGGSVDIYREGSFLLNTGNDGTHTDNTGQKGGGTLSYQVCEAGSTTSCSDVETAVF